MKVEFIEYTGKYPNLCRGIATFKIDDKEYKFGHDMKDWNSNKSCYDDNNFDSFWCSGGSTNWKKNKVIKDEWYEDSNWINEDEKHPQWIIDIIPILIKRFNENVEFGCCGGCL